MAVVLILLRIVHVGSAMAWFGGALVGGFFLTPTAQALGPAAGPFMDHLMQRRRMGIYFPIVAALTILAGAALYWRDSNGLDSAWISSPSGLAFTLGGLAAIVAFVGGMVLIGPQRRHTDRRSERACRDRRDSQRVTARAARAGRPTDAAR